jgi:zinc finger BED domain-containing protein 1 (E3 SUMO-protein ligase ZBED1)
MKFYEISSDDDDDDDRPLIPRAKSTSDALLRYKDAPEIDTDSCPLQWWKNHAGAHKVLATVARKYLASPATTVPCERLFSLSGNILNKKRASLSTDNVNKLVCLSNWLHLQL